MDHLPRPHKRLMGNRKGFSAIIGTIFLVLVVMFLYFNVFMFIQKQDTKFQDVVSQSAQLDADQGVEARYLNASFAVVTGSGNTRTLTCTLENDGPLPTLIVRVWIKNDLNPSLFSTVDLKPFSIVLQPGASLDKTFQFNMTGAPTSNQFSLFFVTSRGNIIPYVPT